MSQVGLPLTGAGDSTANVATDAISLLHYQYVKKADGLAGSSVVERVLATTPGAADAGSVVRPIGSTAFSQAVVGSVGLTSGSSAVELTSVGSTRVVGTVNVSSGVVLAAGSSANVLGSVTLSSVTTAITAGSVAILPGGSTVGSVQQGAGSSANFWFMQSIPFSSANTARTTVNTTVDISIIAANASRKGLVIANLSTSQTVALGLSTGAVTTGLTNANVFLAPITQIAFGIHGGFPLFLGPVRGINISSTTVAGGVAVMEFT